MKVAFATIDGRHVHGELRRTPLLAVYAMGADGWQLERLSSFDRARARSQHRIQALEGVSIAYVAAMGPSTAARLSARGIRAATAPDGTPIEELLRRLSALVGSREEAARCA